MLVIVIGIGLYYNVIIAWILYYLAAVVYSIPSGQLPWTTCGNRYDGRTVFYDTILYHAIAGIALTVLRSTK